MSTSVATRKTVVGVDGSDWSDRAVEWAAGEAERRGCPLRVVHAVGTSPSPASSHTSEALQPAVQAARTLLDDAVEQIAAHHPGLRVSTVLAHDSPASALLAEAEDAALIVLGTRGRGGFSALLLGSVCLRVASHSTCPVVVVRGRADIGSAGSVVVGVQDVRDSEAIRFAADTAARWKASLRAVHAWEPLSEVGRTVTQVDTVRELRQTHADLLSRTVEAADLRSVRPDVVVEREVVDGGAAATLVEASGRTDLVVLAAHRPRGPVGLRLGPVVHAVLHHAQCPVAVVPDPVR